MSVVGAWRLAPPRFWLEALLWAVLLGGWLWLDVRVPLLRLGETSGDFRAYYEAARAVLDGKSPYTEAGFIYPPLLVFLLLPLAALPLDLARLLWLVLSEACLVASFWLCYRVAGRGPLALAAVGSVWLLAGTVPENLVLGQLNPVLVLLLAAGAFTLERRPRAAGFLFGVATALKVWPGALLLSLALLRRWRAFAAGVAVTLVLIAVPMALTMWRIDGSFQFGERLTRVGSAAALNFSLPALALRLADPPQSGEMPASWREGNTPTRFEPFARHGWLALFIGGSVLLAGLAATAWLAYQRPGNGYSSDILLLGAMTAVALLASPIAWYHYQVCQIFAASLVVASCVRQRRLAAAAAVFALLLIMTRTHSWGFGAYVQRWGWTAEQPLALWLSTSLVPVAGAIWAVVLFVEVARLRSRSA